VSKKSKKRGRQAPPPKRVPASQIGVVVAGIAALAIGAWFASRSSPRLNQEKVAAPSGPWMRTPASPVRDLGESEALSSAIGKAVKSTFVAGVERGDWGLAASGLTDGFEAKMPLPEPGALRWEGDIGLWTMPDPGPVVRKEAFIASLRDTIGALAAVERTRWKALSITGDSRRARQRMHIGFAGVHPDGRRVELRGTIDVEARHEGGTWRLHRALAEALTWTESRLPPFRDLAHLTGFGFNPSEQGKAAVQAAIDNRRVVSVGGLTILDFDHDGFWDILATYADRETLLFLNDGAGGFVTKTLPLITKPEQVSKFYLWADLDDDGREELVGTQVLDHRGDTIEFGVYTFDRNQKMRRKKGALTFEVPPWMRRISYESIVVCDVNGDQRLDLLFLGYSHLDSVEHRRLIEATDGLRNLLFINHGNLKFTEESAARGLTQTKYSFVGECRDFDDDGDPDIFVGNDYGKNNVYVNDGAGNFRHDTGHPLHLGASFSMSVSIADYDNTGAYAMSVSNMYSHAGNRIIPLAPDLDDALRADMMQLVSGNTFYEKRDGRWTNVAEAKGVADSGWAWGNVFFDLDNDTDKDLYVVNGFTTNSDPHLPDF